ncbi:MAG: MFS transporter [Spirochaetales bacterium]|nr:MFS transporter [Spirochaetales bacterium]
MKKGDSNISTTPDGVAYRRAKGWRIAFSASSSGLMGMTFYILMGYASYVANVGYGIATAIVGVILTATRILDGVTDPLVAFLIDKTKTKFGKIRIWVTIGWLVETLAVFMMYVWASGKGHGVIFFIATYCVYIIGYTMVNITNQTIPHALTNDPKQRPMVGIWSTVFNYFVPMLLSMAIMMFILPKHGEFNVPMLADTCKLCVAVSFLGLIITCIGITPYDKMDYMGAPVKKESIKVRDMISLFKSNKALQTFIIAGASDKIAQQTISQSIITTLLYGIILGNMQISTILSVISMLPSIIFAIIGGKYAGKHGNKESTVTWTRACMLVALLSVVFFLVFSGNPHVILQKMPLMIIFVVLNFALNGCKMCVTTANNAMMADVIDYEFDRSGNLLPATVTGTYAFIDKLISSFGALIATSSVAILGYTTTMPQPGDAYTKGIFWFTMAIYYGLPLLGWACTLVAMKFSPLSKEGMVEVQSRIASKKGN